MITDYKPIEFNDHIVRVAFNKGGATGHISIKFGGNCRGLDILDNVTDFIETCDEEDIANLVENDCEFAVDAEGETFNIALNGENRRTVLPSATEEMIKELIVAIEITDCTPLLRRCRTMTLDTCKYTNEPCYYPDMPCCTCPETYSFVGCVYDDSGRALTDVEEIKAAFRQELALGHRLLPVVGCKNFDPQRGCLGCEKEEDADDS